MTKMMKSAARAKEYVSFFRCPICAEELTVVDYKSLICMNNHTFDFTKQGYVNMITHPARSKYSKKLFEARHKIIMESGFYTSMHEMLSNVIAEHSEHANDPCMIADLGCGEGSHLQKLLDASKNPAMIGVGVDISKEAIIKAAKSYENPIWIVGDLGIGTKRDCLSFSAGRPLKLRLISIF